ncbi:MAG: DDE-type integrase/transposase/recombinase [Actinobacteria bacterium]|nr:DDE-type integrase/transposase/recombinase [Actinomycetota bacterium]
MDLARFVVDAVVLEGRSYRDVAGAHGVSKSWVAKLVARFKDGGYDAIAPLSKAAKTVANRSSVELEDRIVRIRKELSDQGFDAGAATIHYHLSVTDPSPPSTSTIWRILKRRGFITPQPHKRPKSSYVRFEASLPNETWQSDVTVFELADGTKVEIVNFLDDFSRVCVASKVVAVTSAPDVVATLYEAGRAWGLPASLLTDNGCIYTAAYRHGYSAMESELFHLGIDYKHSRPYHPQTCGKVERFHQTEKKFLRKQPPARTIAELQAQIDRFVDYYNHVRPHRAKNRKTPKSAFDSRDKARPIKREGTFTRELRVRHDRVDAHGVVTIRYKSKLHHIGMGRALKGTRIILLVAGRHIRIITTDGGLLRDFELDPSQDYQPQSMG